MSLWKKVEFLPLDLKHVICKKYAEAGIPIQIRLHAAEWLEENLRPSIQKPDEKKTGEIVELLTEEIRMRGRELGRNWESFAGCQLQKIAADLEKQNPMEVYKKIQACIFEEMTILRKNQNQLSDKKISNFNEIKRKKEKSPQDILISELTQKVCGNRWTWIYIIEILLPSKNEMEISGVAMETLKDLNELVSTFFNQILAVLKWGGAKEFRSEKVEKLYSDIFKMIQELADFWKIQNGGELSTTILKKLEHLKFFLLQNSLFCHQPPPQIIFQGAKVSTAVKFLGGSLNVTKFFSPTEKLDVCVKMVTENQAAALFQAGQSLTIFESSSPNCENGGNNFANEITDLEFSFKDFSIETSDLPKNCTEIVDKKYRLIFYTNSSLKEEKESKVWCLSAPFFIISSEDEERAAHGTILWENCLLSTWNNNSSTTTETWNEIPWSIVRENLSKFFNIQTGTKKPLTMENLNYLGQKLVKSRDFRPDSLISREMLFDPQENSRLNSSLDFWGWFYSAVELTRKHLREFWDNGEILGFADEEKARKKFLYEENPGEILMCFSEEKFGAISVSVIHSQGRSKKFLRTFHPFGESQLERRSLTERIEIISRVMSRACFSDSDSDSDSESNSNLNSEDEDLSKTRIRKSSHGFDPGSYSISGSGSSGPKISRPFPQVEFQVSVHSEFAV